MNCPATFLLIGCLTTAATEAQATDVKSAKEEVAARVLN